MKGAVLQVGQMLSPVVAPPVCCLTRSLHGSHIT